MRNSFINGLDRLADKDPNIFLMVGDLGHGVVDGFAEHHPDRFINAGISEQNMTSAAAGLAMEGYTVYTYSIGNFSTLRCLEQIRNDVCYHGANVKIVVVGGGLAYGQLGMSHHATEDIAVMRALPGMRVFSPSDPQEALAVLREVNSVNGPCYVRLGKGGEKDLSEDGEIADVYQARRLRSGKPVSILATGTIVREAMEAAELLVAQGISASVYSFPCVKPLDEKTIVACASESGLVVTLEEHNVLGGFGGAVAEAMSGIQGTHAPLLRLGLKDVYASVVGDQAYLRRYYQLDSKSVAARIRDKTEDMDILLNIKRGGVKG